MHIFVTGASRGIGASLARAWVRPEAHITVVARNRVALEALVAELEGRGCSASALTADLSDPAAAVEALRAAESLAGPVDVLVNNAGSQVIGPTEQIDIEVAERSLPLDLVTPLRLVHAVLPAMKARRSGTIVNVASAAALAPTPGMTWYNAAKAGLAAASEALRGELRGTGVEVLTVYPGIVETDMAREAIDAVREPSWALRLQPRLSAAQLAERVVRASESSRARLILPRSYGLARWFPAITRWLMDRMSPAFALGGAP